MGDKSIEEMTKGRIFLLEDEDKIAKNICDFLEEYIIDIHDGAHMKIVDDVLRNNSGKLVYSKKRCTPYQGIKMKKYSIAILDINVKYDQEGGLRTLASIKKDPKLKNLPVLICSGESSPENVEFAKKYNLGEGNFIVKDHNEMGKRLCERVDELVRCNEIEQMNYKFNSNQDIIPYS